MATAQTRISRQPGAGHKLLAGTLDVPLLQFNLAEEIRRQHQEDSWLRGAGRTAKTLVKHHDLRIVLVSMKANARMHEHRATARISIQTIQGCVQLRLPERTVHLPAGHLLVLDQCLPHDVEAVEDSAFLLTLSWAPEAEIKQCKSQPKKKVRHEGA